MKEITMEEVKGFVESHLLSAELFCNTREEVRNRRAMCYGVIMFAQRYEIASYEEIKKYWDDWAWEKFEEIAREKDNGPKVEVI